MILIMGAGFLGKAIYFDLKRKNIPVSLFSKNLPPHLVQDNFSGNISDIDHYADVLNNASVIIHTIHTTVPATSFENPAYDFESNVIPFQKLMEICKRKKIKKFVYISSGGAVYGRPNENKKITEIITPKPLSPYGVSKLAIEKELLTHKDFFSRGVIVLRPSNVYGNGQNLSIPQGIVGHIFQAGMTNKQLEIWGDGNSSKDYLYIEDFISSINKILFSEIESEKNVFNVAYGKTHSINEIVKAVEMIIQNQIHTIHVDKKPFDVDNITLSNELFSKTYNWEPHIDLFQGLEKMYALMKKTLKHE